MPRCRAILARLGYRILSRDDFEAIAEESGEARPRPDLLLVDERRLLEVPEPEPGVSPVPILLLTGRHGATGADPRVRGAIRRPAGVHDLHRLLQQVLEETPRSTPRVPTHLRGRCLRAGLEWDVAVLSLSENGCLLRSPEPLPLGTHVELRFALPRDGALALRAETAYQLVPDLGLVFSGVDAPSREAISRFVVEALAAAA